MKPYEGVTSEWQPNMTPLQKRWSYLWNMFWGRDKKIIPGKYSTLQGTSVLVELQHNLVIVEYNEGIVIFDEDNDLPPQDFTPAEVSTLQAIRFYENPIEIDLEEKKKNLIAKSNAKINLLCRKAALPTNLKRATLNLDLDDGLGDRLVDCITFVGSGDTFLINREDKVLLASSITGTHHYYKKVDLNRLGIEDIGYILNHLLNKRD